MQIVYLRPWERQSRHIHIKGCRTPKIHKRLPNFPPQNCAHHSSPTLKGQKRINLREHVDFKVYRDDVGGVGSVLTLKSTGEDVEERERVDFKVYRGWMWVVWEAC